MEYWTLRRLASELGERLGSHPKVTRVTELAHGGLGLILRTPAGEVGCLDFQPDSEFQGLTWRETWEERPETGNSFFRLLQTRLSDARLGTLSLYKFDRVLLVPFQSRDTILGSIERGTLVFEATGRVANLLLLDADRVVVDQLRATANNRPGDGYHAPSSGAISEGNEISIERLGEILNAPLSTWRDHLSGFSPGMCRELAFRKAKSPELPIDSLYRDLLEEAQASGPVYLILQNQKVKALTPVRFTHLESETGLERREFPSVNQARLWIDGELLATRRMSGLRDRVKTRLQKLLEKWERAQSAESTRLTEFTGAETWKHWGDLLLSYATTIPSRSKEARLQDWESGLEVVIPLDPEATVAWNARRYFLRYKKSLRGQEETRRRLVYLDSEIRWVQEQLWFCETANQPGDLLELLPEERRGRSKGHNDAQERRRAKQLAPVLEGDGCRFFVGRNGKHNDMLTFRVARAGDFWFHANDVPGAHVIARRLEGTFTDTDLERGAALAAYFSFARHARKVPVDYTGVSHVKRAPGGGPGRVYYTHQKTLQVDPQSIVELLKEP